MSIETQIASQPSKMKRFTELLIRFRYVVTLIVVAICIATSLGQSRVGFSSDYRYYFGSPSPVIAAMDELESDYALSDSIYISISPKSGGTVFDKAVLSAVLHATEEAWKVPYATRVDSLSNYQNTVANDDDLTVAHLFKSESELIGSNIDYIRQVALAEPMLENRIVSQNGEHTGVNVVLTLPGKSPMETSEAVSAVRELAQELEAQYPVEVRLSGVHMLNHAFAEIGMQDIVNIMPVMYMVMLAILLVLFRSVLQVLMTVAIVHLSTITTMGIVGWLGIPLTAPSSIAPTIILTLAVADSVHIIMSFVIAKRRGVSNAEAIKESMSVNFLPILLTSLTTIIGFVALNFADAPPYHDLGNITAIGVFIAFVLSITLLPCLLYILPNWIKQKEQDTKFSDKIWAKLSHFIESKYKTVIIIFSALTIAFIIPIPNLKLDDRWVEYFSDKTQFRNDADFVQKNVTGLYSIEFNLQSLGSQGISDAEYLNTLDDFAKYYRSFDNVYNVSVLTDTMKRLNKNLHGDDPSFYRIPENKELAAQYLLLYEMSLPYGLDLTNQINMDKSSSKVVITMKDVSTNELREAAAKGEAWLKNNAPAYMHAIGSGATVIFAHQSDVNIQGMVTGTLLSLIMICIVVFIAMRNIKYGLISVLPNVLPAIFAFGAWTLLRGQAGMEVSIVVSATLGVIVDNCVHFMIKYLRGKEQFNLAPADAIKYAYQNVGNALLFTSVTLIAGYTVLTMSSFSLNSSLGLMSALTVVAALLVINILLPAIILFVDRAEQRAADERLINAQLAS
ncbi:efflux RND transporter permease subunit [Pseudoalteromonas maricaloris]|uniref:efflux RND transporter permease subunit n=1 Tax=Pseudoalteromonas maricaloris TaxID=184924 RepID=UPI003C19B4DA